MKKLLKSRNLQITLLFFFLMGVLAVRLFQLTVLQYDRWSQDASGISIRSVSTPSPRGEIYDRYGRLLAGNLQTFGLQINVSDYQDSAEINQAAAEVIRTMEKNGDTYYDNFPILLENGAFVYVYQKEIESWLDSQRLPREASAEEAFAALRNRYEIDEGLDRYAAQAEMQNTYKIFPPISVKNMQYLRELDKISFLQRYKLPEKTDAKTAFYKLREYFEIDPALSDAEARKIMILRNETAMMQYRQYIPAKIATGVSDATVVEVKENSRKYKGIEVVSETKRYYPNGNTASHVLGYLGKISERQRPEYVEKKGYSANDLIGQDGVEKSFEDVLKGKDGIRSVQVNAQGEFVRDIERIEPEKGKDVYLTIDLELQKTAESALKQTLEKLQRGGGFSGEYANYSFSRRYPNANMGAVVVLDVETSDVLAFANYPDFNPNLFAEGISKEDWDSLQSRNPRDMLSPVPLYNIAAKAAVAPGSTFKMVTATAALECGLDPKRKIYDAGYVQVGNRPYKCLAYSQYGGSHGSVDLAKALEVSCNYYFYCTATGRDFAKGSSLNYRKKIDIDLISYYAQQYGLGQYTGIELSETITEAPTAERKMAATKSRLKNVLISRAERYFTEETVKDKEKLNSCILEIISWAEENPSRSELMRRMPEVGIREDMVQTVAELCKYTYFNFASWTLGDELNISIGQGENSFTPLQMANYVATLGNNGVHNKVSVIRAVEGRGEQRREPGQKVDIKNPQTLPSILKGMRQVVSGRSGSMRGPFAGFSVPVAAKTGTAEKNGKIPPPDEVEYMKQNLGRIAPGLKWDAVEAEMVRLIREFPEVYTDRNYAVRQAVSNLTGGRVGALQMDAYKPDYENFAWVVALAPADQPEIAVAVLIVQGGTSTIAGPMTREIIGKYFDLNRQHEPYSLDTRME